MPSRQMSRSHATGARLAVLAALLMFLGQWAGKSPAFSVRGGWEGAPSTLKDLAKGDLNDLLKGLEPNVDLPAVAYNREGLALSVENGRLNADYTSKFDDDKTLNLHIDDEQAWRASLSSGDTSLRVKGQGQDLNNVFWEASQVGSAEGVGDVKVEFNSDKEYNLTVARQQLAAIAGANVDARVRATNAGVTGLLEARRSLPGQAALSYSMENPVGVYDLADFKHVGQLTVPVVGGNAALRVERDAQEQAYYGSYTRKLQGGLADLRASLEGEALGYNVSYARALDDLVPVDADVHVGADQAGVYGRIGARRSLGQDLSADYEATGRIDRGNDEGMQQQLAHALKLSNKLGYVQLRHGTGEAPRMRVGYEFNA